MSCTLATLALCFSLDGFYIHADMGVADFGEGRMADRTVEHAGTTAPFKGVVESYRYTTTERYLSDSSQNPIVTVEVGYDISPRPWLRFRLIEIRHTSSIKTGRDHGFTGIYSGVDIRPWAR